MTKNQIVTCLTSILLFINFSLFSFTDSITILNLHDKAYGIELSNPDSAIILYDSAATISQELGYLIGEGRSYNYKAIVLFEQGKYLDAIISNQKAIPLFDSIDYQIGVASCLVNLGNIELYLGNYEQGMEYYVKGIRIYEAEHDSTRLVMTLNNVSSLFLNSQQGEKAKEYAQKARQISIAKKDSLFIADSYINLANAYLALKDTSSYYTHSLNAYKIAAKTKDLYNQLLGANNVAYYFLEAKRLDSAGYYANRTMVLANQYNNPYNKAESLLTAGKVEYERRMLLEARSLLLQGLSIADSFGLSKLHMNIANQLYIVEKASGKNADALKYLSLYTQLKDSINAGETQRYVHLLEQKYESEKKEQTITTQRAAINNQNIIIARNRLLLIAGVVILILLILLSFLLFRIIKHRNAAHKKEMKLMEAQQKNAAMQALIEGEEKERKRIARELHDGVNGGLAAVKLVAAKEKKLNGHTGEIEQMLDDLSVEVREMSHNLMPGTLAKGNLKDSLQEMILKLNHSDKVQFDLQIIGDIDTGNEIVKHYSYRIIQELLSNVLRHANANECLVQVSGDNGSLSIAVEDNGVGMKNVSSKGDGIGMKNIRGRLEYLGGNLEIDSSEDQGLAVYVEIPNNKMA